VILGVIGIGGDSSWDRSLESALYLGLALSASSTLVVVRLLQQRQQLFEPVGRLVTGVLLLQDLLVILSSRWSPGSATEVGLSRLGVAGTLALTVLACRS
jgi:predicted Kef-type K+ transport protein